jgi:pseudouridine kinase
VDPGRARIACIGGISLDRKLHAILGVRFGTSNPVTGSVAPGGVARNVAHGLARLGCSVSLFSAVGDDAPGEGLLDELRADGVDISGVKRSARHPTASYTAVLEPDGRLAIGLADMEISTTLDAAWAAEILPRIAGADYWFVDANLPAATLERLLSRPPVAARVVADPVSVAKARRLIPVLPAIHALFPDREEALAMARAGGAPAAVEMVSGTRARQRTRGARPEADEVIAAAAALRDLGASTVVVSLGAEGVYMDDGERREAVPAITPARVADVTGAGDALVAGYLYGLSSEAADPLRLGLAAASLAVEGTGSWATDLTPEQVHARADTTPVVPPPSNSR